MTISQKGIEFICACEGFKAAPYQDSVGIWTIGYGTIMYPNGTRVKATDKPVTQIQAMEYLKYHVDTFVKAELSTMKFTQNQYDAIASLVYNIGITAWNKSTLKKRITLGDTDANIRDGFMMWVKAGGVTVKGLVTRRQHEADMYFS